MRLRVVTLLSAMFFLLLQATTAASADPAEPSPTPSPTQSPTSTESPSEDETPAEEPPPSGPGIGVTLINSSDTGPGEKGQPLEGVTLTVSDEDGDEVGSDVTDEQGKVFIPVEELGTYTVALDEDSLPEGVEFEEGAQTERTQRLTLMAPTFFDFPIGVSSEGASFTDQLSTSLVSGVKFAAIIALAALGLNLVFGTTGLTNFSHGELITLGAVVMLAFNQGVGLPVIGAGVIAVIVLGWFGWAQDRTLWRPLRRRGTGLIAMMIVSIGLSLLLRYGIQYFIGGGRNPISQYNQQRRVDYGIVELADKEIWIMSVSAVVLVVVCVMLLKTRLGKAMRAVSDNPALAASSGMRVDGVISAAWIMGAALAGLSGVLLGVNSQVDFAMGFKLLLLVFAAATLGGLGTIWGALFGGLVIGVVVELMPLFGFPTSIKEVPALLILIVILLVRPQGILGRRERVG